MFALYIPKDDELCPEWHIVFQILFPGSETYFKIIIDYEDIDRIKKATGWFELENHLFNKDKAEAIMFFTEYKNELGKWVPYDEEGWNNVLKHELNCELAAKNTDLSSTSSLLEAMKILGMNS